MSDYVYESGMSTKRRRQRRTAVTLLLTLLFLFGAFWWAWSYIRDDGTGPVAQQPGTTEVGQCGDNDPREVTVNVYNASNRGGLAGAVADELRARGFTIGAVDNDPLEASFGAPAQIRYGEPGREQAAMLRGIIEDEQVVRDERTTTDLDIVLGPAYVALLPEPAGVPTC